MFYGQCNDCGERWELGTAPTCKCPDEALASEAKKPDFWKGYVPEPDKRQQALDKKAENARELGLMPYNGGDYEPAPATELREQEPVAWMDIDEKGAFSGLRYWSEPDNRHEVALYTSPPALSLAQRSEASTWVHATEWRGLTNNELQPIADEYRILFGGWVEDFARAIEAKLKEKNT